MTDLDGKNLLSIDSFVTELAYFEQWGRDTRNGNIFFWSSRLRTAVLGEFEEEMVIRSPCKVTKLRLEIFSNATVSPSYFALRKNGNNLIADETDDIFRIDLLAGEIGIFDFPDEEFFYEKFDKICFKWREIDAGNPAIDFQMSCFLQFEAI